MTGKEIAFKLVCLLVVGGSLLCGQTFQPLNSPTKLEVKLGYLPVDAYDNANCTGGNCILPKCTQSGWTVRQCFQSALITYASQEKVTGVTFIFSLCGGFYSTALSNCGGAVQLNATWLTRLSEFFADVYTSGIRNITPAPSWWGTDGENGVIGYPNGVSLNIAADATRPDPCKNVSGSFTVQWWPALPFPIQKWDSGDFNVFHGSGQTGAFSTNFTYSCGPKNDQNSVGWQNIYTVIDSLLGAAVSASLKVTEIDLESENRLELVPIEARFIADNPPPRQFSWSVGPAGGRLRAGCSPHE
jgi:hypothetical protein